MTRHDWRSAPLRGPFFTIAGAFRCAICGAESYAPQFWRGPCPGPRIVSLAEALKEVSGGQR